MSEDEESALPALLAASAAGDVALVEALLAAGAPIDFVSNDLETALTFAIVWNRLAVVRVLLSAGADVELPAAPGWAPLMYAVFEGRCDITELLIEQGANVDRRDELDRTALDLARERNDESLAALLENALTTRDGRKL